ncbi:MAG: ATP-dependent Clp protease ATP-binding subunit [Rhodobacteraceae bacterium]|nr:ATP-dependent Clp protease ATP-binding subunit [Paracoccaceae bacterium]
MPTSSDSIAALDPPAWFDEFASAQNYAQHLVLSGNIRDEFPVWQSAESPFVDLFGVITHLLRGRGIKALLVYDPVSGLRLQGQCAPGVEDALLNAQVPLGQGRLSLPDLAEVHAKVAGQPGIAAALVIDYASHLHGATLPEREDFFVRIEKNGRSLPRIPEHAETHAPTIWLVDHAADLPEWFVIGNDLLREIHVELPNLEDRFLFAAHLTKVFGLGPSEPAKAAAGQLLQQFALECDGETLVAMRSIAKVARAEGITLTRISDAIRIYRTGMRRNPWNSKVLSDRVRNAIGILEHRIKGQKAAIDKTVDILTRSIIGLSGSQSGARHLKPRGVLFLAGPTGVGKTELAKAVTELLFGDETAGHRFDMSEFMEESSIARLVGAPPGHPGHERGGELVNAAHRRPFSVFLFDEVEKAHPRILDVFLQIIDEGRLTDARGATAHFSEALIIFTSNIGVVKNTRVTNMGMNVLPSDSHQELEAKIGRSIQEHFRVDLQRPELLNRIGQNIIIFDFLSGEAAHEIFNAIFQRVLAAVKVERGIKVEVARSAYDEIKSLCTEDYFEGGRGIGNRMESHFINPLAREIFEQNIMSDTKVVKVLVENGMTRLELEPLPQP